MKRFLIIMISLLLLFALSNTAFSAVSEDESTVIGVSTWEEFYRAFQQTCSDASAESYVIRLDSDLEMDLTTATDTEQSYRSVSCYGFVTFDFNGHTLSCTDINPESEYDVIWPTVQRKDFVVITLIPISEEIGSELLITDSVGGGGITMETYRDTDSEISALCIKEAAINKLKVPYTLCVTPVCKLTIDSGSYTLKSRIVQVGMGTDDKTTNYRGAVIADRVGTIEINGGTYIADDLGFDYGMPGDEEWGIYGVSDREITAFGTCCITSAATVGTSPLNLVINGGVFISDGYSIHHFFSALSEAYTSGDVIDKLTFPTINGGIFEGAIGYIGRSGVECEFGNPISELAARTLDTIINEDCFVDISIDDGLHSDYLLPEDVTFDDANCHKFKMMVIGGTLIDLETTPTTDGKITYLTRNNTQVDNFTVSYSIPDYLGTRIYINPFVYVGDDIYSGYGQDQMEVYYGAYYNQTVYVYAGIEVTSIDDGTDMSFYNTYEITVTELQPPSIVPQPAMVRVEPGEWAQMSAKANHAESYQWYLIDDRFGKLALGQNENILALFDGIEGYYSDTLKIKMNEPCKLSLYCVITGADGSTINTSTKYMYFGNFPKVRAFGGGEYEVGGDAVFTLWADYAETLTWMVESRASGSTMFYTVKDFAQEKGCTYTETHQKMPSGIYKATVTFHNVTESFANNLSVGYEMSNSIGTTEFNPENCLPFTKKVIKPEITKELESDSCIDGDNLTFTISALNMTSVEWRFEKPDEDGIGIVYSVDEMREIFPDSSFVMSFETDEETGESTATFVINNAKYEMYDYSICAYSYCGDDGYFTGMATLEVIPVKKFKIADCVDDCSVITVYCPTAGNYTLYIAGYEQSGGFDKLYIVPVTLKRGKAEYPTQRGAFGAYYEVKVMLFDENMVPLCKELVVGE